MRNKKLNELLDMLELSVAIMKKQDEAVDRVRELHKPVENTGLTECDGCKWIYPCETIKALDGEK